jgi:CheY-like chemotaxis protein
MCAGPTPGLVTDYNEVRVKPMPKEPVMDGAEVAAREQLQVLIVDDHPGTQRAVALLLRWLKCPADVASDGREALEAVRAREYHVILMDVNMPRMDGLEATRRIRAGRAPGTGPRVIGMSAEIAPEDQAICFAAGMDAFLRKPVDVDCLIRILDESAMSLAAVR